MNSNRKEYWLEKEPKRENILQPPGVSPASIASEISKYRELENATIGDEICQNADTLQQANSSKFSKKLLRQRSFSADYQPEIVKFQPELPRRFSASPNIGTHRYNNNDHIPHQQQISIDSEESFVTIIPAGKSKRDSLGECTVYTYDNLTDFELEEEDEEVYSDQDISPYSSDEDNNGDDDDDNDDDDDEACCENLNDELTSEDNTSVSSVLEATIRSLSKSDSKASNIDQHEELPLECSIIDDDVNELSSTSNNSIVQSPPITLHRYYHLFRKGELENMIEEHLNNLHIIDSYYNDLDTSQCVVVEKIQVWTI